MEAALARGLSGERDGKEGHGKLFCEPVRPTHPPSHASIQFPEFH